MLKVVGRADPGHLGGDLEEGVRNLAGHHIDLIGMGDRKQKIHVGRPGLGEHFRGGGLANHGADIHPVLQAVQQMPVLVHQGNVIVLPGEYLGD